MVGSSKFQPQKLGGSLTLFTSSRGNVLDLLPSKVGNVQIVRVVFPGLGRSFSCRGSPIDRSNRCEDCFDALRPGLCTTAGLAEFPTLLPAGTLLFEKNTRPFWGPFVYCANSHQITTKRGRVVFRRKHIRGLFGVLLSIVLNRPKLFFFERRRKGG